jgi:hypothetical protein
MKKQRMAIVLIVTFLIIAFRAPVVVYAVGHQESGTRQNMTAARESADRSAASIPVPGISYFQERRTIAKWAQRWDQPNLPCYVYLVSYGNVIGYYVTDGKPSSTGSYLTPEYREVYQGQGGAVNEQLPDIDGTHFMAFTQNIIQVLNRGKHEG